MLSPRFCQRAAVHSRAAATAAAELSGAAFCQVVPSMVIATALSEDEARSLVRLHWAQKERYGPTRAGVTGP